MNKDRPDREIKANSKDPQRQRIIKWLDGYDAAKILPSVSETVNQIIALFPDIEEAKREERERIASKMNRRDVGGVNPEWALSDKDYHALKGD